jgi:hypothetical protein
MYMSTTANAIQFLSKKSFSPNQMVQLQKSILYACIHGKYTSNSYLSQHNLYEFVQFILNARETPSKNAIPCK